MVQTLDVRTANAEKRTAVSKLEPDPKAKLAKLANNSKAPQAQPKPEQKPEKAKPEQKIKKPKFRSESKRGAISQKLPLGAGFEIAHKPGTGYSTLYRVVAQRGSFAEVAEGLKAKKYSIHDAAEARKLLDMMMVPVEKLEEYCRAEESWQKHANRKTESLTGKVATGDKQAKEILENVARCAGGTWSGNIREMVSTCVGYFNYLMKQRRLKKAGLKPTQSVLKKDCNKNVKKFQEAGIVFRRFPLNKGAEKSYVMMFPEQFTDDIRVAIKVGLGVDEDAKKKKK